MNVKELEDCLSMLVGESTISKALPDMIGADDFAENILGFEEVEEIEEDNGEDEFIQQQMMGGSGMYGGMGGSYQVQNDIIPEEDI